MSILPPPIPQQRPRSAGLAIWALVLSLIGLLIPLFSIPGVIMGHVSLWKIKSYPDYFEGKKLALWSIILGYAAIAIYLLVLFILALLKGVNLQGA